MTTFKRNDDMEGMVTTAINSLQLGLLNKLSEHDANRTRLVLRDVIAAATKQWGPVREGTVVISLGRVLHWTCPKATDEIEAVMDLNDTDREAPVWRCRLCGDEIAIFLDYVAASELHPDVEAR